MPSVQDIITSKHWQRGLRSRIPSYFSSVLWRLASCIGRACCQVLVLAGNALSIRHVADHKHFISASFLKIASSRPELRLSSIAETMYSFFSWTCLQSLDAGLRPLRLHRLCVHVSNGLCPTLTDCAPPRRTAGVANRDASPPSIQNFEHTSSHALANTPPKKRGAPDWRLRAYDVGKNRLTARPRAWRCSCLRSSCVQSTRPRRLG